MKTLTVITTTYNRAYCLPQVYESLLRQTSDDFIWMIIDDGSTDDTKQIVDRWIAEQKIPIVYHYKNNGGMHTARNLAYEKVETEINVIIDSDDWMTDDGVEKIVSFWKKNRNDRCYGFVSNNIDKHGKLIGSPLPDGAPLMKHYELIEKYHITGDKKLVLRSDLSKLFPYPEFPGEKFYPASYKFRLLDQEYGILALNEPTCVVDYNEDSMTFHKFEQYRANNKGFAHYRNEMIRISNSPKYIVREMIHYIAESRMSVAKGYLRASSKPLYAIACFPVGLAYSIYLQVTKRKF